MSTILQEDSQCASIPCIRSSKDIFLLTDSWWSTESARLALLMYADAEGRVPSPAVDMTWRNIHAAAITVDGYCVGGRRAGGVWIIVGMHTISISWPLPKKVFCRPLSVELHLPEQ